MYTCFMQELGMCVNIIIQIFLLGQVFNIDERYNIVSSAKYWKQFLAFPSLLEPVEKDVFFPSIRYSRRNYYGTANYNLIHPTV